MYCKYVTYIAIIRMTQKLREKPMEWEKMFVYDIPYKGLYLKDIKNS